MIEEKTLEIVESPSDNGTRLGTIVSEFRSGRNVHEILALLDAGNSQLISIGAWILSELPFESYDFPEFENRLRKLVGHDAPGVRFSTFSALFPALKPQEAATEELLNKLRTDADKGVRMAAEAAAAQLLGV